MAKQYTSRTGLQLWKPHMDELREMEAEDIGFCLACGEMGQAVEPDAERYTCECCGQAKVFGWAELAMRGLVAQGESE